MQAACYRVFITLVSLWPYGLYTITVISRPVSGTYWSEPTTFRARSAQSPSTFTILNLPVMGMLKINEAIRILLFRTFRDAKNYAVQK